MALGRMLRRRARAIVAPLIFAAITGYFLWSAARGDHGLRAYALRQGDLRVAQTQQTAVQADLAAWQQRVSGMRNSHLDEDALDERARAMLNLAEPTDLVVTLKPSEHLF